MQVCLHRLSLVGNFCECCRRSGWKSTFLESCIRVLILEKYQKALLKTEFSRYSNCFFSVTTGLLSPSNFHLKKLHMWRAESIENLICSDHWSNSWKFVKFKQWIHYSFISIIKLSFPTVYKVYLIFQIWKEIFFTCSERIFWKVALFSLHINRDSWVILESFSQ